VACAHRSPMMMHVDERRGASSHYLLCLCHSQNNHPHLTLTHTYVHTHAMTGCTAVPAHVALLSELRVLFLVLGDERSSQPPLCFPSWGHFGCAISMRSRPAPSSPYLSPAEPGIGSCIDRATSTHTHNSLPPSSTLPPSSDQASTDYGGRSRRGQREGCEAAGVGMVQRPHVGDDGLPSVHH